MYRTIAASAIVLVLLIRLNAFLEREYREDHPRHTEVVTLAGTSVQPEDVEVVGLVFQSTGIELKYVKEGEKMWRIPLYRGAYAQAELVEGVVRDIVSSYGIPVDTRGMELSHYGITEESPRLRLYTAGGAEEIVEVVCGRQLPGLWNRDSYVTKAGMEGVHHINGNPLPKLAARGNLPPMVDPKVIPSALAAAGQLVEIRFEPEGSMPYLRVERREKELTEEEKAKLPPQMRDMPAYEWYAVTPEEEVLLDERSAGSYSAFIQRMTFDRLPKDNELTSAAAAPAEKRIVLVFERTERETVDGEVDENVVATSEYIEVRGFDPEGGRYVYYSGTDLAASVDAGKARLLYPELDLLVKKQVSPTVFEKAEQAGAGAPFGM